MIIQPSLALIIAVNAMTNGWPFLITSASGCTMTLSTCTWVILMVYLAKKNIHSLGQGMEQGIPLSKLMHHWDIKTPTKHPEHLLLDACQGLQYKAICLPALVSVTISL
jgi:hypothetical protein